MKCLYYVAPELDSTSRIADDLHDVGIDDFFVHVIAKDESGLKKRHIHAGNYLETLDFIREKANVVFVGPSGVGKTFEAINTSLSIASGRSWHGFRILKRGPVVYIQAEGAAGPQASRR